MYDDPSLIVLDEPNSNLDDAGEQALVNAIHDLQQRGKTIVMITHRNNIVALSNKLLLLVDGGVKLFGPREEVLTAISKLNQHKVTPLRKEQNLK